MTLNEAAAILGVAPATLRQQIKLGALRATKRGRDWWVTDAAVKDYADHHRGQFGRRPIDDQSPRGGCVNCGRLVRTRKAGQWICARCRKAGVL